MAATLPWLSYGCGDDDGMGQDTGVAETGAAETGGAETGPADTSGSDTSGSDTSGSDTSGSDTSGSDTGSVVGGVPTESDALLVWLQAETYAEWPAEAAVHGSTGPHMNVRTFFNDSLAASFANNELVHPVGAASVKELYGETTDVRIGWAVMVKVAPSADLDSWYWWGMANDSILVDAVGQTGCSDCHGVDAVDYVLTPPEDVAG